VNPFDLPGPQFLLFFWGFAWVVLALASLVRRRVEDGEVPRLEVVDPYLVACLRGGQDEAIKLAVLSLCERGLLTEGSHHDVKAADGARDKVTPEIERRVLEAAATMTSARDLLKNDRIRAVTWKIADALERQGLTPSPAQRNVRMLIGLGAFALLAVVAAAKVMLAIERGHHNVGFLVLSCAVLFPLLVGVLGKRQTRIGQQLLADLASLFDQLRARLYREQRGVPHETMLAAAVFGLTVGPFWADRLFPGDAGGGSSGGSSGSSCGSSCGGGCGGGGCGGCGS